MRTWRPVVVGLDQSVESAQAAELAWRIAAAAHVACHVVHAVRDVGRDLVLAPSDETLEALQMGLVDLAREELRRLHEGSIPPEVLRDLEVRPGRAAPVLLRAVADRDAGLLVLGGKHHSAAARWFDRSTAHHVVRHLDVPVLVSAGPPTEKRRVLAAVDLSAAARPTLEWAERFAALFHGDLRVLRVVEPVTAISELPPPVSQDELRALSEEHLEREIWPRIRHAGAQRIVEEGYATPTIVRVAAEWGADVIVVGTHGRGWLGRLLIGSVAEQLLNRLPTTLVVVPTSTVRQEVPAPAGRAAVPTGSLAPA